MDEGRSSQTAVATALLRASHLIVDREPWVFQDRFAAVLAGHADSHSLAVAAQSLEDEIERVCPPGALKEIMRLSRAATIVRARYVEDRVEHFLESGKLQYVILGAGLDSFAYRRIDLMDKLHVFEVDHPETQLQKQKRLSDLGVDIHEHTSYVPIDFERHSLMDRLHRAGYRSDEPALYSWLGVTWYLSHQRIRSILAEIACSGNGNELNFDYLIPNSMLDNTQRELRKVTESLTESRGEIGKSCFEPEVLAVELRGLGFTRVLDLDPAELNARYFANRVDSLFVGPQMHIMTAQII